MSLVGHSAFLILEVINLETQLSSANGKRLKVYPEVNKLKSIEEGDALQLDNFTVVYLEIRHSVFPQHYTTTSTLHVRNLVASKT